MSSGDELSAVEQLLRQALLEIQRRRQNASLSSAVCEENVSANDSYTSLPISTSASSEPGTPIFASTSTSVSTSPGNPISVNNANHALSATGNPNNPSSSGSYLGEIRRLFSPYPQPPASSRRANRTPAGRIRHTLSKALQEFCCLAGPQDTEVPNVFQKEHLNENGLGLKTLEFERSASGETIENIIREAFPKLQDRGFELLVKEPLSRNKTLNHMSSVTGIPSGSYILSRRVKIVYIRPLSKIIESMLPVTSDAATRSQRFFLLQSPTDNVTPSRDAERQLCAGGLGLSTLSLDRQMKSNDIEALVRETYPRLNGLSFELLRRTGIANQSQLAPLHSSEKIPNANIILSSRIAVVYIRPSLHLSVRATNNELGPNWNSNETCSSESERRFSQRLFCLGNPNERNLPNEARQSLLIALGLGPATISLDINASSEEIESSVRRVYPRLAGAPFQMMRRSNVATDRNLMFVSYFSPVPEGRSLHESALPLIYIRPFRDIDQSGSQASSSELLTAPNTEAHVGIREEQAIEPFHQQSTIGFVTQDASGIPIQSFTPSCNGPGMATMSCLGSQRPSVNVSDILAITRFREEQKLKYPDQFQDIVVERDDFEDLLSIYKDPAFKFEKQTRIKYVGEPGRDLGAITKEFFATSIKMLRTKSYLGKHHFFDGEQDYLVPNQDPMLLTAGHFNFLGKFMAHSFLQTGIAFVGLSQAAVRYLFLKEDAIHSDLEISEQDIPCLQKRNIIGMLRNVQMGIPLTASGSSVVKEALAEAGIFENPTSTNAQMLADQLAYQFVLHSRAASFDSIRNGIKNTDVFDFLQQRDYLWKSAFPKNADYNYNAEDIINIIRYTGEENHLIKSTIEQFITSLDSEGLQKLLQAWTGWPSVPDEGLEVLVKENGLFIFHSCFNQLEVPSSISVDDLLLSLKNALLYGFMGFGTA